MKGSPMDEVTLTIPRERAYNSVAHLVVAGLAARLDVTIENLEDLQLALAGVLERAESEGDVTVELRMAGDAIEAAVGPFARGQLDAELEIERESGVVGLGRVLDRVVDEVRLGQRDGGDWLELRKTLSGPAAGGG